MLRKCWADPADLTAAGSDVGDMRDGPCKDAILSATPARPRCRDNAKPPLPCRARFVRLRSRARRCRGPAMRKHFAIAAIVAVLAGPGMREAATAEPQASE